jgi:hypothetical protein
VVGEADGGGASPVMDKLFNELMEGGRETVKLDNGRSGQWRGRPWDMGWNGEEEEETWACAIRYGRVRLN